MRQFASIKSRTTQLDDSQSSQEQQRPEQQESGATHQLNGHFTGPAFQLMSGRTRSGSALAITGGNAGVGVALRSILRDKDVKRDTALAQSLRFGERITVQAALAMPEGLLNPLPPEPTSFRRLGPRPGGRTRGAQDVEMKDLNDNGV